MAPVGTLGFKMIISPPYTLARRKSQLKWGGSSEYRNKVGPVSVLRRARYITLRNICPREPDRSSNFFEVQLGQTDNKGHRDLRGHKVGHGDL